MAKQFLHSSTAPIVETAKGKLRGYQLDGIYTFLGVKYAEAERFQPPRPVEPWEGVKNATAFGPVCPVMENRAPGEDIRVPHRWWPEDEACHYLNIWTNSLDKNAGKPVMVWIHGGMFNNGSSIEITAYDGDAMAKHHDVVFVTLNHRLNILGYFDMSSYGGKYENSVNAGIADLIEALKWIRGNIESFGGDPGNVTIFGQSGGGRKTTTLMQTPEAAGLFHKAIIESGTAPWNPTSSEHHRKLAELMLVELKLAGSEYEKLAIAPYPVLVRAYARARVKLLERDGILNDWTPTKNGWFMGAPPHNAFTEHARKIPLMVGSCIGERGATPPMPGKDAFPMEKKLELLRATLGEYTDELVALFQRGYPGKNELTLLDYDTRYRQNMLNYVERKLKENDAGVPTYVFLFGLEFEVDDGKPAWHCSDIPFAFHNAAKVPVCHIDGVMERLEAEMSGAWASFARSGNPNHPALAAEWPAYNTDTRPVMVFDRKSEVRLNHERELVDLHHKFMETQPQRPSSGARLMAVEKDLWVY
jgi:para-nitrobenzyl esterase